MNYKMLKILILRLLDYVLKQVIMEIPAHGHAFPSPARSNKYVQVLTYEEKKSPQRASDALLTLAIKVDQHTHFKSSQILIRNIIISHICEIKTINMFKKFLVLVITCILSVKSQYGRSPCTTPNKERAQCVSIYSCPILLEALKTRNRAAIDFIKASVCPSFDGGEYVCCGSYSEYVNLGDPQDSFWGNSGPWGNSRPQNPVSRPQNQNRPSRPVSRPGGASLLPGRGVCGQESLGDRILNGEETYLDEFPWMALLEYQSSRGRTAHACGGMLISDRYVLTAAHCVVGAIETAVGKLFRVRLGEWDQRTNPDCISSDDCAPPHQDIRVESAIAHPEYNDRDRNRYHDIALVRLASRVSFSDYVKPICLPRNGDETPRKYWVAGWGTTENGRSSPKKLKLLVPAFDQGRCQNTFRTLPSPVNLARSQLCAGGEKDKDSCQGDSGGPLMFKTSSQTWIAAGVVSFGVKCGTKDVPGVYTRLSEYIDWINENIRP